MAYVPQPPPDPTAPPAETLWCLNRAVVLAWCADAYAAESPQALHGLVQSARAALHDSASVWHVATEHPDAVVLRRWSLEHDLQQVAAARTQQRARYYLQRLQKKLRGSKTRAVNDLDLYRWKEHDDVVTDSLWIVERRDRSGVHRANYWGNFVPQIPYQMMRRYTKRGDLVLDPFAGMGTTLIEAQRLGRHVLGVELQPDVAAHARDLLAGTANPHDTTSTLLTADSIALDYPAVLAEHGFGTAHLVMLHPPYHDIIQFSDDARDLCNTPSIEVFLERMQQLVTGIAPVVERGRYLVLVIGDKYTKGEWIPLGFRTMETVQQCGFTLKSIVVKNFEDTTGKRQQQELWRYRALAGGFYVFKHEYLFVMQRS